MSFFDVFNSVAFILSTLPLPSSFSEYDINEDTYDMPSGIYGAMGNEETCTAQGFFVQLGFTSALYNMVLTFYYLFVIKFGMTESQIQRYKLGFHVPVLVVGFALAF